MTYQTCWQILTIQPIRDKKTIKRAYSKLLKTTRPDEKPEEFKQLHGAYEEALSLLDNDWYWEDIQADEDEAAITEHSENQSDDDEMAKEASQETPTSELTNYSYYSNYQPMQVTPNYTHGEPTHQENESEKALDVMAETAMQNQFINQQKVKSDFFDKISIVINSRLQRNLITAWDDILNDDLMFDIGFKKEVGTFILGEILEQRQRQIDACDDDSEIPDSKFDQPTLAHLSGYFGWQNDPNLEHQFYHQGAIHQFFDDLEPDNAPVIADLSDEDRKLLNLKLAPFYKRFLAFVVDMMVLYLVIFLVWQVLVTYDFHIIFYLILIPTAFFNVFLQTSPVMQGSFGQYMFGLKLVDINNKIVTIRSAAERFCYCVSIGLFTAVSLINVIGFVLLGAYLIDKYRNRDKTTWLDTKTKTFVVLSE